MVDLWMPGNLYPGSSSDDDDDVRPPPQVLEADEARQDPPSVRVEDDEEDFIPEADEIDPFVHELSDNSSNNTDDDDDEEDKDEESIPRKLLSIAARYRELLSFVCRKDVLPLNREHLDAALVECERKMAEKRKQQKDEVERKRKQKKAKRDGSD